MRRSARWDDLQVGEFARWSMPGVFGQETSCAVVRYANSSRPRIDFLRLAPQGSFEQILFDGPEEPIGIGKDDLRQGLSSVFPEFNYGPGHRSRAANLLYVQGEDHR